MVQGREKTTIHLDLLQVGPTSLLVSGAQLFGRDQQRRKNSTSRLFLEVYRCSSCLKSNSPRRSTNLPVECAFRNSCPRSKRKIQATVVLTEVYTGTAQVCFLIVVYTTVENVTKFYSGLQKKKIIRVKSQANECPSVSAAQGKLLPKDTTENVTTLIYSGFKRKKN